MTTCYNGIVAYNILKEEYGEPFTMCDRCFDKWKQIRTIEWGSLVVQKMADKSLMPCNECEEP